MSRIQLWDARGIPGYLVCKIDEETGTYLTDEENSRLIQTDWDYPSIASTFGWDIREVQPELFWYTSGSGRINLQMTWEQAESISHRGQCDSDVLELSRVPEIREQLEKIDPAILSAELREYGAWDETERQTMNRIYSVFYGWPEETSARMASVSILGRIARSIANHAGLHLTRSYRMLQTS